MIEVLLNCPRCNRLSRVSKEFRSMKNPDCGHGTIITPTNAPNLLQCVCGQYLDDQHVVDSPQKVSTK